MENSNRIGFIGLGNMGGPLAERLAQSTPLVVYDLDQTQMQTAVDFGAVAACSPMEVAEQTDVVLLSLPISNVVEEVILGTEGLVVKLVG